MISILSLQPFGHAACLLMFTGAVADPSVAGLTADPGASAAPPALEEIGFIAGHWRAEVPGGELEEIFTVPAHGSIVGLLRWGSDGATTLTEHITIEQRDRGVVMYLRHFHPGNVPWDSEMDGPLSFTLTEAADGRAVFTNSQYDFPRTIVYHQPSRDAMTVTLEGHHDDGTPRQLQFAYTRSMPMTTSTEITNDAANALGYTGGLTIAFNVTDLSRSKKWYQEVLGFNLLYEVEEIGWCELTCPANGVQIGLSQVEEAKVGGPTPTFAVGDIDEARAALESRNVRFDGPTIEIPGMVKLATFYDPDGNAFMLSQSLVEGI